MPDPRDPQLDELRRRARRRLVGAVVLALAAAVLVPMLLESDPKPLGEDVSVKIPPVDDGKFVNKLGEKAKSEPPAATPRPESKAEAPTSAADANRDAVKAATDAARDAAKDASGATGKSLASAEQRVLAPPPSKPAPAKDALRDPAAPKAPDVPAAGPPSEPAPKAAEPAPKSGDAKDAPAPKSGTTPTKPEPPKSAEKAAEPAKGADGTKGAEPAKGVEPPKAGTYSVQLAAFIDDKGANALAGRLKKSGYSAYTEPYSTSRGTLWRVRVGPFPTREAAETARSKLKGEGQNGIITAAK